jgi:hypothetical protein
MDNPHVCISYTNGENCQFAIYHFHTTNAEKILINIPISSSFELFLFYSINSFIYIPIKSLCNSFPRFSCLQFSRRTSPDRSKTPPHKTTTPSPKGIFPSISSHVESPFALLPRMRSTRRLCPLEICQKLCMCAFVN